MVHLIMNSGHFQRMILERVLMSTIAIEIGARNCVFRKRGRGSTVALSLFDNGITNCKQHSFVYEGAAKRARRFHFDFHVLQCPFH
jgi:hypothetical protein